MTPARKEGPTASINSTLLAEDVQGRVDTTRIFDGREINTEYLFGLFANLATSSNDPNAFSLFGLFANLATSGNDPNAFSLLGIPTSYEITHFAASENIASASTRFQFFFQAVNTTLPVQIQTWNVFNSVGQISMYDATFTGWWQWVVDILLGLTMDKLSVAVGKNLTLAETMTYVQTKLATSICSVADKYCVGPVPQQYQNITSCYDYLTTITRFEEAYELEGEDTRRYVCLSEQPTQKQNATGPEDFKTTSPGSSDGSLLPTATLAKSNESISKETAATRLAPLKAQYTRLSLMVDPNSDTMKLLVVGG
ncbi:MAG: hypothetical protein Q9161_001014 [Pseudevernia consocians]